jgi:hypothetical protein
MRLSETEKAFLENLYHFFKTEKNGGPGNEVACDNIEDEKVNLNWSIGVSLEKMGLIKIMSPRPKTVEFTKKGIQFMEGNVQSSGGAVKQAKRKNSPLLIIVAVIAAAVSISFIAVSLGIVDATYKTDIESIQIMFLALFGITIILERTTEITIGFIFDRKKKAIVNKSNFLSEILSENDQERRGEIVKRIEAGTKEDTEFRMWTDGLITDDDVSLRAELLLMKQHLFEQEMRTSLFAVAFTAILALCISLSGVLSLHSFIDADKLLTQQKQFLLVLDILITASLLTGGSRGVHTLATTFIDFMKEVRSKSEK